MMYIGMNYSKQMNLIQEGHHIIYYDLGLD